MINRDEIYHHGVSGMKWGKRNGPPYPLNAAGKASLAKQRKSSGRASSGDTTEYGSILSKKKKVQKEADYSKMSDEEKSQAKQKAIREGNIREANANRNEYTDQELKAVKERFQLNSDVAKLSKATVKTGQQKADEIASKFETAARLTNAVANTAQNSVKIYNSLGAVAAKLNGTKFEPIGTGGGKNKNKGKDNTEMKGMPEKKSLIGKLKDYVSAKAATSPTKSKPSQQSKEFESEMTKNGYKSDANYSNILMTKKAGGMSINVDKGNDVEFSEVSKNVKALEPKASQIKQDFVKQLKSEGYGKLSSKEPSLYITDTLAEVCVWGDDGHEYSTYVDLKTGKLEKGIMTNG